MYLQKIEAAYAGNTLENKFKKLIGDIIALDYAPAEEQKLLNILKETYKEVSKAKRTKTQASIVVADMNWDAIIKENKEKREKIKKEQLEDTKHLIKTTFHRNQPIKQKVAKEVEQMGTLIKFDFRHPASKEEDLIPTDKLAKVKTSMKNIDELIKDLGPRGKLRQEAKKAVKKAYPKAKFKRKIS